MGGHFKFYKKMAVGEKFDKFASTVSNVYK